MTTIAKVNRLLAKANRTERLVRNQAGGGYYYVSGVSVSSSLCVYRLDAEDLQMAIDHVCEVISNEDGKPFKFTT